MFRGADATSEPRTVADLEWWQLYQDETLQQLIGLALEQNRNVLIAAARIEEARANVGIARIAQFPRVSIGASGVRQRLSTSTATPVFNGAVRQTFSATLDASYEVDLWGRLAALTEAARADLLATRYAQESVRISLISDVATAYFTLLAYDQQIRITERTIATRQRFLELTNARFSRGITAGLDVDRAQASLSVARSTLPDLRRLAAQTENTLQILLGQNPGADRASAARSRKHADADHDSGWSTFHAARAAPRYSAG